MTHLDSPSRHPASSSCAPPVAALRIAVVEHLTLLREAIARICEQELGHTVVAEIGSAVQAMKAVVDLQPDVMIVDLPLPDMDGFALVAEVGAKSASTRVLIVSGHLDDFTVFRIEKASVQGFVDTRQHGIAVLRTALNAVASGGSYFSPSYEAMRKARHADPRSFDKVLSETEQRILPLIADGMTDEEIGHILQISPRTVRTHRHNILRKLRVAGTPKLIAYAMRRGFTTQNPPLTPGAYP